MGMTVTTSEPVVVVGIADLGAALAHHRAAGRRIGFVPTMGALHDGHAELVRTARRECDVVVTSCYVNPTQFLPGEDLDRYPRTPERDVAIAGDAGTDVLWRPTTRDMYGDEPGDVVRIHVGTIGTVFEGRARPGHFDGVATIVVRLLAAVGPDVLYLGAKDFQQVVVLRRVVRDLLLPVEVRTVATVREADGLARSSRNAYLGDVQRQAARAIPRALEAARTRVAAGSRDAADVRAHARDVLAAEPGLEVDYVELVDAASLAPIDRIGVRDCVLLVAARVGSTRLIDNLPLPADDHQPRDHEVRS